MAKTLCDWSKRRIESSPDELQRIVSEPNFYCRKCARVACSRRYLCKGAAFAQTKLPAKVAE